MTATKTHEPTIVTAQPDTIRSRPFAAGDLILSPGGRADMIGVRRDDDSIEVFHRPRGDWGRRRVAGQIAAAVGADWAQCYRFELVERLAPNRIEWTAVSLVRTAS